MKELGLFSQKLRSWVYEGAGFMKELGLCNQKVKRWVHEGAQQIAYLISSQTSSQLHYASQCYVWLSQVNVFEIDYREQCFF